MTKRFVWPQMFRLMLYCVNDIVTVIKNRLLCFCVLPEMGRKTRFSELSKNVSIESNFAQRKSNQLFSALLPFNFCV